TAQQAFSRVIRGLPSSATDDTTTLGKIGATLDQGDLKAAQGILDGLETKAMKVLRAVQKVTEEDKSNPVPPGSTFRITVGISLRREGDMQRARRADHPAAKV